MKYYAGRDEDDPPLGGGDFPVTEGYCGEECNFVRCDDGFVYGHFETSQSGRDRKVNIERLGAGRNDEFLDGVDIIWTAPIGGKDPRTVVGWYQNARLYRSRQKFNGNFPSNQHLDAEIESYQVRAEAKTAVLLSPSQRTMKLSRGPGWSGQASCWYAEETKDLAAVRFVEQVKALLVQRSASAQDSFNKRLRPSKTGRAGVAATEAYSRYVSEYEARVHPRHSNLEKRFKTFLSKRFPDVIFPQCYRDDLRYEIRGKSAVMVEIKPCDNLSIRYSIRTAIGQLLDYRQQQDWRDLQLILLEREVTNIEDQLLAFDNGFGLAWPKDEDGFEIRWPE